IQGSLHYDPILAIILKQYKEKLFKDDIPTKTKIIFSYQFILFKKQMYRLSHLLSSNLSLKNI
ncbi:hypothetical protein, partial [Candidatus Liberibacter asiaticus]|uniref:hypothetical protein n=1 Tax=Liberibacter asiaticus TaxID=34021 RepID=UPI001AED6A15